MKVTELLARITADATNFNSGIDAADRKLKGFGASAESTGSRLAGFGRSFGTALSVAGFAGGIAGLAELGKTAVAARARMDGLERGLTSIMGSADGAAQELEKLNIVAKLPGLGFEEAAAGSVRLQAAGLSADMARKALSGFGNALGLIGSGKAELDGVIRALGQIAAKGKVSAEEINQIAERVPQIRQIMQSAFGTADTEALQKMGISSKVFIERIIGELDKLPKATGGLKNDLENFSDSWNKAMAAIGKAVEPAVSTALGWFAKLTEGLVSGLSEWDKAIAALDKAENAKLGGYAEKLGAAAKLAQGFVEISKKLKEQDEATAKAEVSKGFGFRGLTVDGKQNDGDRRIKLNIIPEIVTPPPTKEQLGKWKKEQEEATKDAYAVWAKLQKDMEFLNERGFNVKIGGDPKANFAAMADIVRLSDEFKKVSEESWRVRAETSRNTIESLDSVHQKAKETIPAQIDLQHALVNAYIETGDESKLELLAQVQGFDSLATSAKAFGAVISSVASVELQLLIKQFKVLEQAALDGKIGMEELSDAYEGIRKKTREAQGDAAPPIVQTKISGRTTDTFDLRLMREVSTVMTDMSRNLTDLIFQGGKFKDVMADMAREVGKSITRFIIQEGLAKVGKELAKLMKDLPGIGGILSKIPGVGGGAQKIPSIGGAGGSAGGLGGAGGGAASGASSTLSAVTGVIGAIGSIGTMISSIVFGVKAAKDADVANKHSLQLVMQGEALFDNMMGQLSAINARLNEFRTIGIKVFTLDSPLEVVGAGQLGGGGVVVTQNVYGNQIFGVRGMELLADELVRLIKARW